MGDATEDCLDAEVQAAAQGDADSQAALRGVGLPNNHTLGTALCNVKNERFQQERLKAEGRFRFTCADLELSHAEKLAILTEEVGEVAQQVLEQPDRRLAMDSSGDREHLRRELEQVAAVAVAWIESIFEEAGHE